MTESLEVAALRALAARVGARVTDVSTPGIHSAKGYHYATGTNGTGLAVDLAWQKSYWLHPIQAKAAMLAYCKAMEPYEPQFAEFICSHLPYSVKNGQRVARYAYASHLDHIHVAVNRGFRFTAPTKEIRAMYDPPLQIAATLDCPTGGTWAVAPDGAIYAFGGAPYLGGANGKPYFVGRTAARLELVDGKYRIIATSGEGYGPGF